MHRKRTVLAMAAIAVSAVVSLSACSAGAPSGGDVKSLTLWDGFTQYNASSPYGQLISTCETQTKIKIDRTSSPNILQKLLQSAASKSTPNLTILDNPDIAKIADAGLLAPNDETGLTAGDVMPNVLSAGNFKGKTYGAPIGSNTLALFYNTEMFKAKGLTPPTNWEELTKDAAALTSGQVKGIGFSAAASEEGTFQFLPFFWGSGAKLDDITSSDAVDALSLWTKWVQSGSASAANVNDNQQDIRDQFAAGKLGMMVNGTWQLTSLDAGKVPYAVVPIPAKTGGNAPSPLGGEFVQIVNADKAHETAAAKFAECMIKPANLQKWAAGQSYIMPYQDAANAQAKASPALQPWVSAVKAARGRTTDLGTKYPDTSKALYTAIQEALTGSESPKQALTDSASKLKG